MKPISLMAPWAFALLAAAATLSSHAIARAQDCASDADCRAGFTCRAESYESCSGSGMCDPNGDCTEEEVTCETVEYHYCTNATCTSDADCPDTMACAAQTTWVCDGDGAAGAGGAAGAPAGDDGDARDAGAACAPDEMCPPSEYECHEVPADSLCIERYNLPCEVGSDCGGGFDCLESSYWVCEGGGAAGAGGATGTGGAAGGGEVMPPPTEPTDPDDAGEPLDCHVEPSGYHYCQLQELPCETNADCPSGLECIEQYSYPPCMGGGEAGAGAAGSMGPRPVDAGSPDSMGGTTDGPTDAGVIECPAPELQHRCMPPEWGGGYPSPDPGTGGTGSSADAGTTTPPAGPGGSAGSGGSGGSSAPPTMGGGDGDSEEPSDDDTESDENGHGHGHGHGHAWGLLKHCSASGPIGADPSFWWMLGMTALVLRRRARR